MKQEGPIIEVWLAASLMLTAVTVTGKPVVRSPPPVPSFPIPPLQLPPVPTRPPEPCKTVFCADDYPAEAARLGQEGTVTLDVLADRKGKPTSCKVAKSSGHKSLDDATCPIIMSRQHYEPAKDSKGRPQELRVRQKVRWELVKPTAPTV